MFRLATSEGDQELVEAPGADAGLIQFIPLVEGVASPKLVETRKRIALGARDKTDTDRRRPQPNAAAVRTLGQLKNQDSCWRSGKQKEGDLLLIRFNALYPSRSQSPPGRQYPSSPASFGIGSLARRSGCFAAWPYPPARSSRV
jgi:hypothetical protein